MKTFSWFLLFAAVCGSLVAQEAPVRRMVAPVEGNGFTSLTSYDSLKAFLGSLAGRPGFDVSALASTRSGRSVFLVRYGQKSLSSNEAPLRVLLFAQQHGDEPAGKEALTMLLAGCASGKYAAMLSRIDLRIVPQMNPDGAEQRQRRTSDGIDLNRSHLILNSPETAALHEMFLDWKPQVTLDMHEYGAMSEEWIKGGYIKRGDVQLGMLTNLNSSGVLRAYQHDSVFPFVAARMEASGFSFHEYIVGSPQDRIRHSTTEPNDGRQSFGILNTLAFIQEGRKVGRVDEKIERRARSQLAAVEALLAYCNEHAREIGRLVETERTRLPEAAGSRFVLRMEHIHGNGVLRIPVELIPSGRDTVLSVTPYHEIVRALASTTVPVGYCIPADQGPIIDLLRRHHVKMEIVQNERSVKAETCWIDSVGYDVLEEDSLPRPFVHRTTDVLVLHPGDVVVPSAQWHSMFLPTMLEPESMWGLVKYDPFAHLLRDRRFPVSRIVAQ